MENEFHYLSHCGYDKEAKKYVFNYIAGPNWVPSKSSSALLKALAFPGIKWHPNAPLDCYINGVLISIPAKCNKKDIPSMIENYATYYMKENNSKVILPAINWWRNLINNIAKENMQFTSPDNVTSPFTSEQDSIFLLELVKRVQKALKEKEICILSITDEPCTILRECMDIAHLDEGLFPKNFRMVITPTFVSTIGSTEVKTLENDTEKQLVLRKNVDAKPNYIYNKTA